MLDPYEIEIQKVTNMLINTVFQVKKDEIVVITADSKSNQILIKATAAAIYAADAKPVIIYTAMHGCLGHEADQYLPVPVLTGALSNADVWIEYNSDPLLYTTPFEEAMEKNKKLRYMLLCGLTTDEFLQCFKGLNIEIMGKLMMKFKEMNSKAKRIRITTSGGTDVTFLTDHTHVITLDYGDASIPGFFTPPGDLNIVPEFGSTNGIIVFDGAISMPTSRLLDSEIVKLTIEDSKIVKYEGGAIAKDLKNWIESFNDPLMSMVAHMSYGLGPNYQFSLNIGLNERVWGICNFGFGHVSPLDAPPDGQPAMSHFDAMARDCTVYLDDVKVIKDGSFLDPELLKYEQILRA